MTLIVEYEDKPNEMHGLGMVASRIVTMSWRLSVYFL